ncbi:helix-turn-helix domain-containing protein [Haloarculaceae archaeon H-GB2-1]|nr:helix-turn-helix domain-containing protein [Haloarculaceae archaeon H-GB1-1]MEA5407766.1 helix-turn-helix domain-containing protein [Haloarculaceae archaeon H-GB2-1]
MHRRLAVGLAVLALLGVAVPYGVVAAGSTPQAAVEEPPEFESTSFEITVYQNGSARWAFEHSRPLANESERKDYEAFAEQFNSEEGPLYRNFQTRTHRLLDAGRNATGREMKARNFSREASVSELGNRGVLRMSFIWEGFAPVEGDRVMVGDVFEGGLYVAPDQRLVIVAGPNLSFDLVGPEPDAMASESLRKSDSVTWKGEREFTDKHPRIEFVPTSSIATETAEGTANVSDAITASPSGTTNQSAGGNGAMGMLMVGLLVIAIGLGGAAIWHSGGFSRPSLDSNGGENGGAAATSPAESESTTPSPEAASRSEPAVSDVELLSDTDRVVRMLEDNGGRMKQVDIVDGTDWSKSKVSMLLSDMEEEGVISKLRVGRENIISLKGFEPEAAGSPFEEED